MKPKWFYDVIGMMAHNPRVALRAWDAELLDEVKVNMLIEPEYINVDDVMLGQTATVQGQTQVVATISDTPKPHRELRFEPIKIMIRPDSLVYYVEEMNPDNPGQYRPYTLFESMYIDYGRPIYSYKADYMTGRIITKWDHHGDWDRDGKWYLVYPEFMTVDTAPKSRKLDRW